MNLMELFVKIGVDDQASSKVGSITDKIGGGLKTAANIGVKAITAASTAIVGLTGLAIKNYAEYEQLAGGAEKIFDKMNPQTILSDAQDAYFNMGLSANQYLAVINDVGAAFASTMGDEKGYEAAKTGLQAISDYASGTGKNVDLLSEKFMMITRSTSSYQSIADQFSGILPATSKDFLAQAQAAGILSDSYTELTQVPIAEYQQAVSEMLKQGVADLGLAENTAAEAMSTISGSLAATKAAWSNLITGLVDDNANFDTLMDNFTEIASAAVGNLLPRMETALKGIGTLIEELFPVIMDEIPTIITDTLPSILESAVSIVTAIGQGLLDNAELILNTAVNLILTLAEGLAQALPELVPAVVDVVLEIVNTLTNPETLINIVDAAVDIILALVQGLIGAIPELIRAVPKIIASIVTVIIAELPTIVSAAIDIVFALINGLIGAIPELVAATPNLIIGIVNGLLNNLDKIILAAPQIILSLITGLIGAIPQLVMAITNVIMSIVKTFMDYDWGSIGKNIVEGLENGIAEMRSKLVRAAVQLVAGIVRGIGSALGSIVKAGNNLVTKFANGINNKISTAVAKAKNLASRVVSAVRSGIGNVASVGANLVEGLWNGVSNKVGWVTQKMASFGRQVLGALKTFFGIKSPSRLMRDEIGRFLAEGVAVGFMENDPMAEIEASLNNGIKSINVPSVGMYGGVGGFGGSGVSIIQNIYSQAQTAADLMQEAIYQQEKAVYLGV